LYKLLMALLGAVPSHTQKVENSFSTLGQVLTPQRTFMSSEIMDGLMRVRLMEQEGGRTSFATVTRLMMNALSNIRTHRGSISRYV